MTRPYFDMQRFANDLALHRLTKSGPKKGLRTAAAKVGISWVTLNRAENCKAPPDLLNYAAMCKWMGKSLDEYFKKIK